MVMFIIISNDVSDDTMMTMEVVDNDVDFSDVTMLILITIMISMTIMDYSSHS